LIVIWWKSSVGQKAIMAFTGLALLGFVMAHLLGNLLIFIGPDAINSYAKKLQDLGGGLWMLRGGLIVTALLHIWTSILVVRQNKKARPSRYKIIRTSETTLAARTMMISGLFLLAYIIYHLLHFTFKTVDPTIAHLVDSQGRHDVYSMMVIGFRKPLVSGIYVVAMAFLCAHIYHGLQSAFQTLGLNNDRWLPRIQAIGRVFAIILFLGYVSIPAAVFLGLVVLREGVH